MVESDLTQLCRFKTFSGIHVGYQYDDHGSNDQIPETIAILLLNPRPPKAPYSKIGDLCCAACKYKIGAIKQFDSGDFGALLKATTVTYNSVPISSWKTVVEQREWASCQVCQPDQPPSDTSFLIKQTFNEDLTLVDTSTPVPQLTKSSPYDYQVDMYQRAMAMPDNSLIFLPTGFGKTLISAMFIRRMLQLNPLFSALFIVETNALAIQQYTVLINELGDLSIRILVGSMLPSKPNINHIAELRSADIIVATAGSYLNAVEQNLLDFGRICALVMDEAHHCAKNHLFNSLLHKLYGAHRPKIMALTASPAGELDLLQTSEKLEKLLKRLIARPIAPSKATLAALRKKSPRTPLLQVVVKQNRHEHELLERIRKYFLDIAERYFNQLLPLQSVTFPSAPFFAMTQLLRPEDEPLSEHLVEVYNACSELNELGLKWSWDKVGETIKSKNCFGAKEFISAVVPDSNFQGSVVNKIEELVTQHYDADPKGFSALIFVSTRGLAIELVKHISRIPFIKAEAMVGISEMTLAQQKTVLSKFRDQVINVVVSTSVCGEGVDIPACCLVICTCLPNSMISFVQIRGRIRSNESARYLSMVRERRDMHVEGLVLREDNMNEAIQQINQLEADSDVPDAVDQKGHKRICGSRDLLTLAKQLKPDPIIGRLQQRVLYSEESRTGPPHCPIFTVKASLPKWDGTSQNGIGYGPTKKIARYDAIVALHQQPGFSEV